MQTGTKISGVFHVGFIGFALFGGSLFSAPAHEVIEVASVSVITSEEFAALRSSTPEPNPEPAVEEVPEPIPEIAPEVQQPESVEVSEEAIPELQPIPEVSEQEPEPLDQVAIAAPDPAPAPRIDTQSAPKPDINAQEAEITQEETTPDENATETAEETEEQAPKEAATEIVTEAEEQSEYAPTTSSLPRARPRDIKERVAKLNEPKEEPEAQEPIDNTAEEIAKALAEAQQEAVNNQPDVPTGPPLTGAEREGLVLAVQKCWNVPIGLENSDNLAVVLAAELTSDGQLASNPKLIEPAGAPQGTTRQAFEAARRALIRCAPYDLPQEKYDQWRYIEVVFNPERMAIK